ncbi:hypothetical protein DNH61_11630 [Paenibacillus sambharensis]|uniref:Uncharacterized protein n=1 Tax=Paenibacillus sambharensis TaxID=1803190 RepID=A0A2W1L8H0_9BACL|nr:hypothetical protein DNH61_11630 [Paenibacillus sambharensis]
MSNDLLDEQVCPYCGYEVGDHLSNWSDETEHVECGRCRKTYAVAAEYQFLGFKVEKMCIECGEVESECFCEEGDEQ